MKINKYIYILFLFYLIYGTLWSTITVLRYLAFNSGVFDLGVASQLLYSVIKSKFLLYQNGQPTIAMNKLIYIPMGFLYSINPDPKVLLIFQSFYIPLAMFPLFGISKHYLNDDKLALLISLTYIFYYPLGGVNWFDFHFMALFPPLFLTGFYFYLKENYKMSALFFILSNLTDYLVPLIVIIFSIITFIEKKNKKFSIILAIYSTILFIIITVYFGIGYLFYWTNYISIDYYMKVISTTYTQKIMFLIFILSPLLFIPLLDYKYIYLIIPYLGFAFLNNYFPYIMPMFFQYPSLYIPILFISLLSALFILIKRNIIQINILKRIIYTIFIINVILALFLMPWGPINSHIIYSYSMEKNISVTIYDKYLWKISSLIPYGSTVLIQDNMPNLCEKYNYILPDFMRPGTYPEYIITDPYSRFFDNYSVYFPEYNQTMFQVVNEFILLKNYSIYAEAYGMILLKENYSGYPLYFVPMNIKNKTDFIAPGKYIYYGPQQYVYFNNEKLLLIDGEYIDFNQYIIYPKFSVNNFTLLQVSPYW